MFPNDLAYSSHLFFHDNSVALYVRDVRKGGILSAPASIGDQVITSPLTPKVIADGIVVASPWTIPLQIMRPGWVVVS